MGPTLTLSELVPTSPSFAVLGNHRALQQYSTILKRYKIQDCMLDITDVYADNNVSMDTMKKMT